VECDSFYDVSRIPCEQIGVESGSMMEEQAKDFWWGIFIMCAIALPLIAMLPDDRGDSE
jgi:hypothetical protein